MFLRDIRPADLEACIRMRGDPAMMADLGGPLPRDGIERSFHREVAWAEAGTAWIKMILPTESSPVAGTVTVWQHDGLSEIGWLVLPEFQGRGLAGQAVREILHQAGEDGRWGVIHAYPGTANGPSNSICRSAGFTFVEELDLEFAGRTLRSNHWLVDPGQSPR
jgi:RimJ/RimL family protein N-acetyltransferase